MYDTLRDVLFILCHVKYVCLLYKFNVFSCAHLKLESIVVHRSQAKSHVKKI